MMTWMSYQTKLLMKMRNKLKTLLLTLLLCLPAMVSWAGIPDKPTPERLVNDFAGLLTPAQKQLLEDSLVAFSKTTSTQICVVTVTSLDGYDVADYAQQLGEKWGIGVKGKNNGALLLVKPKTEREQGRAFIATGYGLEGALPDIICYRIVNNIMIPYFKNNDYGGGIIAGAEYMRRATRGEFTADPVDDEIPMWLIIVVVVIIILMVMAGSKGDSGGNSGMNNSNRPRRRVTYDEPFGGSGPIFGGGSSRGSSRGGGMGDVFGGFGGGSFGGGGGGGSW